MAIADIAQRAKSPSVPWRTCQVCHALTELPETEATALRELLASRIPYTELAAALQADPDAPNLNADVLSRHARGRCEAREKLR
jgi:hypothetical protein